MLRALSRLSSGLTGRLLKWWLQKKTVDNPPAAPIDSTELMKNSPLITVLLVAVSGLAALGLGLALKYEMHVRQVRQLQSIVKASQNNRSVIALLVNEANEYSRTHPGLDPILLRFNAKLGQPANSTAAKPAGK